jgi:hypothetical protein
MVARLSAAGMAISLDEVLEMSAGGAVGRSHVARALVAAGHADSIAEAFTRFIGRGRPFYVAKDMRLPAQAIDCIRDSGGIAVIAHPGVSKVDDLLREMVEAGLQGIEAYHADHSVLQRNHYAAMSRGLGLLTTGGSDFHGPGAPNARLGEVDIPDEAVIALLQAGGQG